MGKKNMLNKYKKKNNVEDEDDYEGNTNDFNVINEINETFVIVQKVLCF